MANKEIKQTIRLSGEKEYSAALREAQRNLKTLRSELKAETAELGSNATAQQKNEARTQSLRKQIAEQEKVVETLKKALAEAKKDYGDNEDVVQKWEQKLNEARATLADMQNGLSDAENAMRGATGATAEGVTATKSFADALNQVASVGESVSGAIESIFTGLVGSVRDVVTDLWEMIGDTAAKANNWTDIAGYWNTDPVNVQKWENAIRSTSNEFADFQAMISRLTLGGKEKEIAEMLGVSDVNYESQWAYAVACMEQISKMTKDGSLPDNFWEEIFGEKKATKAMDIINDWDEIQRELSEYDPEQGGFGLDSEQIAMLNQQRMDMDELQVKWESLQRQFAAGLAPVAANIMVNVEGSLDALNEFMNADTEADREAALEKLKTNIEQFFEKVGEAIRAGLEAVNEVGKELQGSDDPIVSAVGNLMVQLTDALEWIVNNQNAVKHAFEAIFGVWFLAKLTAISGKLADMIAQIEIIKAFKGLSGMGSAAAGAGANAAGAEAGGAGAAAAGGISAVGGVAGAGLIAYGFYKAVQERLNNPDIRGSVGYIEQAGGGSADLEQAFVDYIQAQKALQDSFDAGIIEGSEVEQLIEKLNETQQRFEAQEGHEDMLDAYSAWRQENSYGSMDWLLPEDLFDVEQFAASVTDAIDRKVDDALGGGTGRAPNAITSDDVGVFRGLPGQLRQALFGQISGLQVTLNGEVVGRILTPYVSANIARDAVM